MVFTTFLMEPTKEQLESFDKRGYYWEIPKAEWVKQLNRAGKIKYVKIYGQTTIRHHKKAVRPKKG